MKNKMIEFVCVCGEQLVGEGVTVGAANHMLKKKKCNHVCRPTQYALDAANAVPSEGEQSPNEKRGKMTDEQIKELAEKHGWFGVEAWWSMAIPRFRAMLEEHAAQQSVQADKCQECGTKLYPLDQQCPVCGTCR